MLQSQVIRQNDSERNLQNIQTQNYNSNQARRNSTAMVQPKSNTNETQNKYNDPKLQLNQKLKQTVKEVKQQNGAKNEKVAEQQILKKLNYSLSNNTFDNRNIQNVQLKTSKIQTQYQQEQKQKLNISQSFRMQEQFQNKEQSKQMIVTSSSTKVYMDAQDRKDEEKQNCQSFINTFQNKKRTISGHQNHILDENIQDQMREQQNQAVQTKKNSLNIQNQQLQGISSDQFQKSQIINQFTHISKPQQYTSEMKELRQNYNENQQIENLNSGQQNLRNYSGSLNKDQVQNSIYQSQRSSQAQLSKFSSRGSSNNKTVSIQQINLQKTQISGTLGSESTTISQSGRSGETGLNDAFSKNIQLQTGVPGIPLHPKLIQYKNVQKPKQQQFNSSGFMTQNQTPNSFNQLNSTLNKQKQYYSNKTQSKDEIDKIGKQIKNFDKESSIIELESLRNNQGEGIINNKIQKFDFTDYDHHIEEELRIPGENRLQEQMRYQNLQNLQQADSKQNIQQHKNQDIQEKDKVNESGKTTPNMMFMTEQNILEFNQRASLLQSQRITLNNVQKNPNLQNESYRDSQKEQQSTNQKLTSQQKYLLGQSRSTEKITINVNKKVQVESSLPFDETIRDAGILAIDENKMQQYQQVIQNVRLGIDEMKSIINQQAQANQQQPFSVTQDNLKEQISFRSQNRNSDSLNYNRVKEKNMQVKQAIQKNNERLNNMLKDLEIEIPGDDCLNSSRQNNSQANRSSNEQQAKLMQLMQDDAVSSSKKTFQAGEENLMPSTEKKNSKTKLSAYSIPKSGGGMKMMMTSSHLLTQLQGQQNRNIFLSKLQSVSTRNNMRYQNRIDEDLQAQIDSNQLQSFDNQNHSNQNNSENQNSYDSIINDIANQHQKIICSNLENKAFNEKSNIKVSQKQPKYVEINLKKQNNPERIQNQKEVLSENKYQSLTKESNNKSSLDKAQRLSPKNITNQQIDINAENIKKQQILQQNIENGLDLIKNQLQNDLKIKVGSIQKGLGIRSGSESNVKPSAVFNGPTGFKNIENFNNGLDQRFGIQPAHKIIIPNDEPTKTSNKRTGIVRAYAANTNQGLVRNYNEDRVSIITNLLPPKGRKDINPEKWPRCSYFGIYDGHGGSMCADFLRDNLHQFVIMEPCFPKNPKEAIVNGFAKAEKAFIDKIYNPVTKELIDKSGSCAIVVLIVQDICYVANVGDSRATLSSDSGQKVYPLSLDHKPGDENEIIRIRKAGGEIYYRTAKNQIVTYDENKVEKYQQMNLAGPLRVLPGRLSVARTFGDPEAKIRELNGNPNVVIHNPDIKSFQIKKEHDFIVLGCDGIFDKMSNNDVVMAVWKAAYDNKYYPNVKEQAQDIHKLCGMGVDYILKNSLLRRSLDNVTVVIIGFSNFKHSVFGHQQQIFDINKIASADEESLERQNNQQQNSKDNQDNKKEDQTKNKLLERTKSANLPRDYQQARKDALQLNYQNYKQEDPSDTQKKQQIVSDMKMGDQTIANKLLPKKSPASISTVSSETKRNFENGDSSIVGQGSKAKSLSENIDSQILISKQSGQIIQNLQVSQNQIQGGNYLNTARLPNQKDNKPPLSQYQKGGSVNLNQPLLQQKALSTQNLIQGTNKAQNLYQQQYNTSKQPEKSQIESQQQENLKNTLHENRRPASTRHKQGNQNYCVFGSQKEQED